MLIVTYLPSPVILFIGLVFILCQNDQKHGRSKVVIVTSTSIYKFIRNCVCNRYNLLGLVGCKMQYTPLYIYSYETEQIGCLISEKFWEAAG